MQPVGEFLDMRVMTREIVEMRQFFPEQRILRQGAHQDGEEIPSGRLGDAEGEVQARLARGKGVMILPARNVEQVARLHSNLLLKLAARTLALIGRDRKRVV